MVEDEDANTIRRTEKKKSNPPKGGRSKVDSYSKFAVGGESKEVAASTLDENDNFIHRREQNQPKYKKSTIK